MRYHSTPHDAERDDNDNGQCRRQRAEACPPPRKGAHARQMALAHEHATRRPAAARAPQLGQHPVVARGAAPTVHPARLRALAHDAHAQGVAVRLQPRVVAHRRVARTAPCRARAAHVRRGRVDGDERLAHADDDVLGQRIERHGCRAAHAHTQTLAVTHAREGHPASGGGANSCALATASRATTRCVCVRRVVGRARISTSQ